MRVELWNIVLAAGAGRRLAGVTGGIPKQFWSPDGGPTLLEDTLDRSASLAPPDRTTIVVDRTHAPFVRALPQLERFNRVVYQPRDRGTAAGVLLGLTEIVSKTPEALILLTPSDHGIASPNRFVAGVRRAALEVQTGRAQIVLFGVAPETADNDYGWIMPAATPAVSRGLRAVAAFVEKPAPDVALRLFESGAVLNTMVLVARASTLLALYHQHLPTLLDIFIESMRLSGPSRSAFLRRQYEALPVADFSRDLLSVAHGVSLHTWPASIGWSDLGTPARLERWRNAEWSGRAGQPLHDRAPALQPIC
jgi:mannose-1-phosphate guanylyltransferase